MLPFLPPFRSALGAPPRRPVALCPPPRGPTTQPLGDVWANVGASVEILRLSRVCLRRRSPRCWRASDGALGVWGANPTVDFGETMSAVRRLGVIGVALLVLTIAACTSSTSATTQTEAHTHVTPTAVTGAAGYFWLLGEYRCATGTCPVVMRSTDGGKSFVRVGSPPASVDVLQFANHEDGYAYSAYSFGSDDEQATLYWTGNGGRTWQLAPLRFSESRPPSMVITSGRAYLLDCENYLADGDCESQELASSVVTSDTWMTTRLQPPVDEATQPVGLASFGSKVWLIAAGAGANAALLVSDDGGRSFASLPSTGLGGLACGATATSDTTLWGFCATGLLDYAARSTDGGRHFALLPGWNRGFKGGAANSGQILPLSNTEAIFRLAVPGMWLTRNGGAHFSPVRFSSLWQNPNYIFSIAFASATTWLVLGVQDPGENNPMWRTTDGGRSWQQVKTPILETGR